MTDFDVDPYLAVRQSAAAPWPGPRGPQIELAAGVLRATVLPLDGCRLTSFTVGDLELIRQWNPECGAYEYGSYPMVPWVGRVADGVIRAGGETHQLPVNMPPFSLHGMTFYGPWTTLEATSTTAAFEFPLADPWPWPGRAIQRVRLAPEALELELTIESHGTEFPAAAGWHPWFTKWTRTTAEVGHAPVGDPSDELVIDFSADWQAERGPNGLPTERRITQQDAPWDDYFVFERGVNAVLTWPRQVRLDIASPAASLIVYSPEPDAACVEPQTGPPNGVNTRPRTVTADDPLVITTRWAPTLL